MALVRRVTLALVGLLLVGTPVSAEPRACGPGTVGARALWALADVDGDRLVDVVRVSTAGASTRPEKVAGRCALTTASPRTAAGGMLTVRDVDADRDLDLVQVDAAGTPVRMWLNDGAGGFRPAGPLHPLPSRPVSSLALVHTSPLLAMAGALNPRERPAVMAPSVDVGRVADGPGRRRVVSTRVRATSIRLGGASRAPPPSGFRSHP